MTRIIFTLATVLLLSACANKLPPLPGKVVDVEIIVPDGDPVILDWVIAGRVAAQDGFPYERPPVSPQKPTPAEAAEIRAVDAENAKHVRHIHRPDVLKRAEALSIPILEEALLKTPRASSDQPIANNLARIQNNASGPNLKLVLNPTAALASRKSAQQLSNSDIAKIGLSVVFGSRHGRSTHSAYIGSYELINVRTGNAIKSGNLKTRVRETRNFDPSGIAYPLLFATMIWAEIAKGAP